MSNYNFKEIETKWQNFWRDNKTYKTNHTKDSPKFYALEMFMYPSGKIHIGHVRNYTIGDVVARYKRLKGFNVLHPMGFDAFGLPAENAALENGIHPSDWTYKNMETMKSQLESFGFSYDMDLEIKTCSKDYYKHQQKLFIELFKMGLVYKKNALVNWDPVDNCVLSNEQVIDGCGWRSGAPVQKKNLSQWFLKITKYQDELLKDLENLDGWPEKVKTMQQNWIGKSYGAVISFEINEDSYELINDFGNAENLGSCASSNCSSCNGCNSLQLGDSIKESLEKLNSKEQENQGPRFSPEYFKQIDDSLYNNLGTEIFDLDDQKFITTIEVFSTRPETLFGATFLAISVDHEISEKLALKNQSIRNFIDESKKGSISSVSTDLAEKKGIFTGIFVDHPFLQNKKIPVYIANFVLSTYGKGAIFGTPAHDERDFEFAKKYDIDIIPVISSDKSNLPNEPYTETEGKMIDSDFLNGISVLDARKIMIDKLQELGLGSKEICYKLRDWGISRQRYWGCPIPMIECPNCGIVPANLDDLPIELPYDIDCKTLKECSPLSKVESFVNCKCPKCGSDAKRDTDTMDTFVDSSWYYARFTDPKTNETLNKDAVSYWLPVDQYVGGIEHAVLHLLYARFFFKALRDLGYHNYNEPFKNLLTQGMVCHPIFKSKNGKYLYPNEVEKNENGEYTFNGELVEVIRSQKMSKSKKNVVDPDKIINAYGADTVRLFIVSDVSPQKDLEWSEENLDGCYRFLNKYYKIVTTAIEENNTDKNLINKSDNFGIDIKNLSNKDLELLKKLEKTVKNISNAYENLQLNKVVSFFREFTNSMFSYIQENEINVKILTKCIYETLLMIEPIAPHMATDVLFKLENQENFKHLFPSYIEELTKDQEINLAVQVNGKLRGVITVSVSADQNEVTKIALENEKVKKFVPDQSKIKKIIFIPQKLISFVI